MRTSCNCLAIAASLALLPATASTSEVEIRDAWIRGTVAGQQATGAFMEVTSKSGGAIVGAASPAAGVTEIHEMKMDGGVMKMRTIDRLELPAGKSVRLAPGGYHVMLMDLKQPLKKGDSVPMTLQIEGKDKQVQTLQVNATVRDLTTAAPAANEHQH